MSDGEGGGAGGPASVGEGRGAGPGGSPQVAGLGDSSAPSASGGIGGTGRSGGSDGASSPGDDDRRRPWGRDAAVVVRAVWARPRLWGAALGALRRMARRGWWRRAPFLPVPGEQYWRFRLETAYGGDEGADEAVPSAEDVVAYLRWCQRSRPGRG